MAVLQEDVVSLKAKVKEIEKQASLAFTKANTASTVADLAKKASDTLSKQVDKLAVNPG